jgi:hypothetical protein
MERKGCARMSGQLSIFSVGKLLTSAALDRSGMRLPSGSRILLSACRADARESRLPRSWPGADDNGRSCGHRHAKSVRASFIGFMNCQQPRGKNLCYKLMLQIHRLGL